MKNKVTILSVCILSSILISACTSQQKAEGIIQTEIHESESVSVMTSESTVLYDLVPMVMVRGKLYYMTEKESTSEYRCGTMDGEITSNVDETQVPTQNNQSNFGIGFGYQFGIDNTIEINLDNKWIIFEERSDEDTKTVEGTVSEVVIEAHIKETEGYTMIISSDSDEYPGVFLIDLSENVSLLSAYEGGDLIIIHMIDKNSENQGMKEFLVYSIRPLGEKEEVPGKEDILLTGAPMISLTDVLSSTKNELEVPSGNYEWNYKNGEQMESVVACGAAPLDKESASAAKTMSIPDYNGLEKVMYSMNTVIPPDKIVLTQWDASDIGKNAAEPVRIVQYYCQPYLLELEKDAVYEITATWNKSNLDTNGFYGSAGYNVITQ